MQQSGQLEARGTWVPGTRTDIVHPHMSDAFARVYEATAHRNTGQIAAVALDRVGGIGWGTRVLDIAAGAGALSVPAALRGASVLAIDHAPGMVRLVSERLAPFPASGARVMDGQRLDLGDGCFDATFSLLGASMFNDWRAGLSEQVRVTRAGGRACVATWRRPPGGGPFLVLAEALRAVFPDMPPPATPEGFATLADPERLREELVRADLTNVTVEEFEVAWEGPSGAAYLKDVGELYGFIGVYAALDNEKRQRVDAAVLEVVDRFAEGDRIVLRSPVVLAVGVGN
ncbi:class I SAM-dependent methyltransferase [Sphingomonas sp.]|uniref:class I SAM-dependent methyltransferase n=1 Tax=Sphingomonas sp. TaxID=28214 RepID=UPI0035C80E89